MTGIKLSVGVAAPLDVVWSVLVDVERMPEWTTSMRSVRLINGAPLRRGSRVRVEQPWLPAATWTIDLFDPPRYFSWRSRTGMIETVATHLLEDRGEITYVTLAVDHSGPGARAVGLLTDALIRGYVRRELTGLRTRAEEKVHED